MESVVSIGWIRVERSQRTRRTRLQAVVRPIAMIADLAGSSAEAGDCCPLCSSSRSSLVCRCSDRLLKKSDGKFRLLQCTDCGLIRTVPFPAREWLEEVSSAKPWWESSSVWRSNLADSLRRLAMRGPIEFVRACAPQEKAILDVNGGMSFGYGGLRADGYTVEGRDLVALRRWRGEVETTTGIHSNTLPVSAPSVGLYGTVVALHVLEHVPDPSSVLAMLRDMMADEGSLVLSVPNSASWQAWLLAERWNGFDVPRHPLSYDQGTLEATLNAVGLTAIRCKGVLLLEEAAGLVTSLYPSLDPTVRRERGVTESRPAALMKSLAYLLTLAAAVPLVLLEAWSGAGSVLMVEARRSDGASPNH